VSRKNLTEHEKPSWKLIPARLEEKREENGSKPRETEENMKETKEIQSDFL